jgi:hypothetical protein
VADGLPAAPPSPRPLLQRDQRIADQVGGGLVAGIEDEDAVLQQLVLRQLLAAFALDQPREHVVLGSPGSRRRCATSPCR